VELLSGDHGADLRMKLRAQSLAVFCCELAYLLAVRVHLSGRVPSSDGVAVRRNPASPTATRKSNSDCSCCRQVPTTVNSRSTNRLPASLPERKLRCKRSRPL
jgi:hypothetical protein